ncbi:MAG TPA: Ig-like domain repeat protein [Solirubrobacterales bacterium]
MRWLAALALTAAAVLALIPAARASAAAFEGTVRGQAPGVESKPIAGVEVTVLKFQSEEVVAATSTDESGKYVIEAPVGVYDMRFEPPAPFEPTTIHGIESGRTVNVVLARAEAVHLTGTLRDAAGEPVPGATLYLNNGIFQVSATTAADGSYDLAAPTGKYELLAYSPESGPAGLPASWFLQTEHFALESDQQRDLNLPPTSTLTVEAHGKAEAPIAGAAVDIPTLDSAADLGGLHATHIQTRNLHAVTGEEGRASFTVFDGGATLGGEPILTPPAESGFARTAFEVPQIEGDTTVVVQLGGNGEEAEKDEEAPQVSSVSFSPTEVETTSGKQLVTVFARIRDLQSGPGLVKMYFHGPGSQVTETATLQHYYGEEKSAIFKGTVTFGQFSEPGEWKATLSASDNAGNTVVLTPEMLEERGEPSTVYVFEKGDEEPPHLVSLTFEPAEIDTSSSEQAVTVVAHVEDNLSGAVSPQISFRGPGSGETGTTSLQLVSGKATDGIFEGTVTFEAGSEPGTWPATLVLADEIGNTSVLSAGALEELGQPGAIAVEAATPTVTGLLPGSGTEAGGTQVEILGSGLRGAVEVRFGSKPALEFFVASPGTIVAIAPPGSGTVDVTVTKGSTTSATGPGDRYRYSPPVTLTASPNPSVHGAKVTFTAKVTPLSGSAPTPLGTVAFVEGSNTLGVANLSKGTATFKTTSLGAGEHPVRAVYGGDSYFGASESEAIGQLVERAATRVSLGSALNPAPFGFTGTLKATVSVLAPGAGTPAGTVTFEEGETVLATVQLAGSSASLSLKTLSPGSHEITATYSGDSNDQPSESPSVTQTITEAVTKTNLTSTLNPAAYGSAGTLKATVEAVLPGAGTPSGTITFREGEMVLAIVPLSGSTAKYALKSIAPGEHAITATYTGDGDYQPSGSSLNQVVEKAATALTLTSSKNPAPHGSTGTLKATVKAVPPGGGTPTGSVTFREGATVLAIVPLSGSAASYPLKSLPTGVHEITATYGGDPDYSPSESALVEEITP